MHEMTYYNRYYINRNTWGVTGDIEIKWCEKLWISATKKKKGNKDAAGQQNTCNEVYNKNKEFVWNRYFEYPNKWQGSSRFCRTLNRVYARSNFWQIDTNTCSLTTLTWDLSWWSGKRHRGSGRAGPRQCEEPAQTAAPMPREANKAMWPPRNTRTLTDSSAPL